MAGIKVRHYNHKIQQENEKEYKAIKNELVMAFEKEFNKDLFEK